MSILYTMYCFLSHTGWAYLFVSSKIISKKDSVKKRRKVATGDVVRVKFGLVRAITTTGLSLLDYFTFFLNCGYS